VTAVCPSCHAELRSQSRFCPKCGQLLEARLAPGALLKGGDYRIVRSLTKGGMGAVYLAQDRRAFDRLCVVKQMLEYYDPANPAERDRAQQRFEVEGRTLASLSHPGIPKIYAFFSENGRHYIVMEYIQGENLETFVTHENDRGEIVPAKRLPQEEIVRYAVQGCNILQYLHSQQRPVVHQDIKPGNLILESQLGLLRLVDFGTARAEIPRELPMGHSGKESVYGTDGYAPPEQYKGKPGPRSDVFALAATTYHLLTDDDPRDHPFKFPKLKNLPRELGLALERALRLEPEQRSSAKELGQALEALSTPRRTLETFTFPGGAQIRSVTALPALCDEHWDAARTFLYNGDFQRWLRDINRHDLAIAADETVARAQNHDTGLETFLHLVDDGLPKPKIVADPPNIALGKVARESALIRRVTALNITRGYTLASVTASQPWIEVFPSKLHLWAGIPVDIRINVRAEGLPFRSQQSGVVTVTPDGHEPLEIPVAAQVSLTREVWRIIRRALLGALPEAGRTISRACRFLWRATRTIARPFLAHPLLFWLLWLSSGAACYMAIQNWQTLPLPASFIGILANIQNAGWESAVALSALAPLMLVAAIWLALLIVALVGGGLFGALRGAWKSFFR